ncbi:DUF4256 domain-containing protein [Sphingobacterium sp. SGL-16]|uniref:DUF4256 domain-containing protein n=1 Tax=Sphingobacterium sp. SGL-16 TaxID=2710883 RepID=UPI0013EA8E6A|nr:DUF4256 domain-containing protein [Sphingobacterium sp. SGL-16]NGM72977.1 DUF4256 domain-containing protein [Sphingobacterium sp. SGL-16]
MKTLDIQQETDLLNILEKRFHKNSHRHPEVKWEEVYKKLKDSPLKLSILFRMEETGGEPDVICWEGNDNEIVFVDCVTETPKGRRSICYDHEALEARKQYKPENSAINMAEEIGIELLDENQYFELQKFGEFDLKTSSWIKTPKEIRDRGGALFGDKRFGRLFIYHNGADSYYGVRGFRGFLRV